MKISTHKIKIGSLLIFFLFSTNLMAKKRGGITKTKTINETYSVSEGHKLLIENKFGEVKITSWDKNEVSMNITISVEGNSEKDSQEKLDNINIDVKKTDNVLSIITLFKGKKNDKNMKIKGSLSIDYELKVPANNLLHVKNSFGPLFIDKMNASTKINLSFGSATIGELNGDHNNLEFQFSDPIIIKHVNKGQLTIKHSKLELEDGTDIAIASEMSSSKIGKLQKGQVALKFGSSDINELGSTYLTSQMSSVKIGTLYDKGDMHTKYGSLSIGKVKKGIESLIIDSEFSPVKINLEKAGSYAVDVRSKMGNLNLPSPYKETKDEDEGKVGHVKMASKFIGTIGNKDASKKSKVRIQGSFGSIKLSLLN